MPQSTSFNLPFRPVPIFPLQANQNYTQFRQKLETIDDILKKSNLDEFMIQKALEIRKTQKSDPTTYQRGLETFIKQARTAFRVCILRSLKGCAAVRSLEISLADSALEKWFCFIDNFDQVKAPSKSTIDRYKNMFGEEVPKEAFQMLLEKAASAPESYDSNIEAAVNILGFEMPTNLLEVWYDSTCLNLNIHFPVDWVQLGSCCKSLLRSIHTIRKHGVINRMPKGAAGKLLNELNNISIELGNARRRKDSKTKRKQVFRRLKIFSIRIAQHAHKHIELLKKHREKKTSLSQAQADFIINRMQGILEQLPKVRQVAHERIIGERRVASKDKIISPFETNAKVMARGKSGAEVEFGNQLMIGENRDGLIVFYELYEEIKSDSKLYTDAILQTEQTVGAKLELICGDRGFSDVKTQQKITESRPDLKDHTCPKSVDLLKRSMEDDEFKKSQKRRCQTEARIAIIKNVYHNGRTLSKGIASQRLELNWVMLTHNLCKLAQMRMQEAKNRKEAKQKQLKKAS